MSSASSPRRAQPVSLFVLLCAGVSGLAVFATVLYYGFGFYENDPEIRAMLPAVALCFGVGLIFFAPAFAAFRLAQKNLRQQSSVRRAVLTTLFNLPIFALSLFILKNQSLPFVVALIVCGLSALFCLYGIWVTRQLRRARRRVSSNTSG